MSHHMRHEDGWGRLTLEGWGRVGGLTDWGVGGWGGELTD